MNHENCQTVTAAARRPRVGRRTTLLVMAFSLSICGCNSGIKGLVSVSGTLTYKGKPWPFKQKGYVTFSPLSVAQGGQRSPGAARLNEDGSFKALTADSEGLMPGEYGVAVRCMLEAANDRSAGKSAIPDRYGHPTTSGLKVTVPEGGKPVVLKVDIEDK